MTPWWVTAVVGLVTAAVTIAGVVVSSGRELKGLRERIEADGGTAVAALRGVDRSEWFRRVQWAHGLLQRTRTEVAGGKVLWVLSIQADNADAALISALVDSSSAMRESAAFDADTARAGRTAGSIVDSAMFAPDTGSRTAEGDADG